MKGGASMKSSEKEALVHEYLVKNYKKYYRIAYSYVFQEQDAMDIVQESAYRAILKSGLLKQPEYVDTWICRIVIHESLRYLEKYKKQAVNMEDLPEQGTMDQVEDVDLKRALDKLDEKERAIVVLRYFEEEKLETIGDMLDLNVNTVKSRLYRAMGKLKKYMETGGAGYAEMERGV